AAAGGEVVLEAVVLQRVELAGDFEDDVAAAPTVTAVRSATRHELFAAEAQGTGATVPTLDEDLDAVREHQDPARPGDLCSTGLDGLREHGDFLAAVPRPLEADHPVDKRSEEHTSELQSRFDLVCRLLLEKKKHYSIPLC